MYFPKVSPGVGRRPAVKFQGSPSAPTRPRASETPSPREVKQQLLNALLAGANANRVRELAIARPDLIEAASPDQRSRMTKILLERFFFGAGDRQAIMAILKPAQGLGELPATSASLKAAGAQASLYSKMGDVDEGLDLAKLGVAGGLYDNLAVVEDLGATGVKALVRVATNEQLDAMNRDSKAAMIGILQSSPQSDETEVMIRRLRNHMQ